ncbi:chitobiase/beta-hexosaminidase C-terminal domain-containing protein [Radiobacillus deserti]|nr:chitobiase/beta-hexosaminidase C-terminal domain-containing protein [Radiobacillus deserti]
MKRHNNDLFNSLRKYSKVLTACIVAIVSLLVLSFTSKAAAFSGAGAGTASEPYIITSASQLDEMRNFLSDTDVYFELGNDIDLSSFSNWDPIGENANKFSGHFDGNNHVIKNLHIAADTSTILEYIGLFAFSSGTIEHVILDTVHVEVDGVVSANIGGLVGQNEGVIRDVSVIAGTIQGKTSVGGLVGINKGTIESSVSNATVTGHSITGGLVGTMDSSGSIKQSYATGNVSSSLEMAGGLIGSLENGQVMQSHATGEVKGMYSKDGLFIAGGLIGEIKSGGQVTESYATGNVFGSYTIGGLVGLSNGSISKSYAIGNVTATQEWVGGLIGKNDGYISETYAVGKVTGNVIKGKYGGLIGENIAAEGDVTASFWDMDQSGNDTSDGGEGKTTAEMVEQTLYHDAGWDGSVWEWPIGHYPKLKAILEDDDIDVARPIKPTVDIAGGTYNSDQTISLLGEAGATIYYTLDGTTPTIASTEYQHPITISETKSLKAITVDLAGNVSEVLEEIYIIDKIPPGKPNVSLVGGLYNTNLTLNLSGEITGTIYFTLDGTTPTIASTKYEHPITISDTKTLKAITVDSAGNVSEVLEEVYTIDKVAPAKPSVSVQGGTYYSAQTVALSAESGATIYFTLDGTAPTQLSQEYDTPLSISQRTTLKAIAVDEAGNLSDVTEALYNIGTSIPLPPPFYPIQHIELDKKSVFILSILFCKT